MKLYVICGHGAGDPGAGGHGYTEAERVRALGQRIKELGGDGVVLLDTNRNWYADAGLDRLSVPADAGVVELHMDSGPAGARGGHVIIKAGYEADAQDRALAEAMARIFPGRANTIVGRSDLANVNRAARRGINYRLVENGFISDAKDVETFNSRMDEVARAYLDAFGIGSEPEPEPKPEPNPGPDEEVPMPATQGAMRRLYNPHSQEHLYTTSASEAEGLLRAGWQDEGTVGTAPEGLAVLWRLYNPTTGRHMWTDEYGEVRSCVNRGWAYEGEACVVYAGGRGPVKVHRLYNPNDGRHLLTSDEAEIESLAAAGWRDDGVKFSLDAG